MRDILFRGKRKDIGLWEVGDFIRYTTSDRVTRAFINGFDYEVHPETVSQYTGLTDKNGKKIFEGDILDTGDGEHWELRFGICGGVKNVSHEVGYAGFYLSPLSLAAIHNRAYGQRNDPVYYLNACEARIIGNIHDNPELLRGADNGE